MSSGFSKMKYNGVWYVPHDEAIHEIRRLEGLLREAREEIRIGPLELMQRIDAALEKS